MQPIESWKTDQSKGEENLNMNISTIEAGLAKNVFSLHDSKVRLKIKGIFHKLRIFSIQVSLLQDNLYLRHS